MEKHPLTTPGPFSTPPLPRHPLGKKHSLITMTPPMSRFEPPTSRTNSPIPARPGSCASGSYSPRVGEGFRSSPKPHSSPKMKLRFCFSLSLSLSHPQKTKTKTISNSSFPIIRSFRCFSFSLSLIHFMVSLPLDLSILFRDFRFLCKVLLAFACASPPKKTIFIIGTEFYVSPINN